MTRIPTSEKTIKEYIKTNILNKVFTDVEIDIITTYIRRIPRVYLSKYNFHIDTDGDTSTSMIVMFLENDSNPTVYIKRDRGDCRNEENNNLSENVFLDLNSNIKRGDFFVHSSSVCHSSPIMRPKYNSNRNILVIQVKTNEEDSIKTLFEACGQCINYEYKIMCGD